MKSPATPSWTGALVPAVVLALVTAVAAVVGTPAPATADPLGITLVHLRPTSVELSVVCPTDPPTTVLVLAGETDPRLVGHLPMDCVGGGVAQAVVVPLTESFAVGSTVDLAVTVSGDSGEINAWFPGSVVEPAVVVLQPPGQPSRVRVRAWARTVVVRWRAPVADAGGPVRDYRVGLRGRAARVAASTRRLVVHGLHPSQRYVVRVAACNAAGRSNPVLVPFRTRHR